jgi:hypothetical protein
MIEVLFVDIKNFCVFDLWNFVVNEKSRFGNDDLFRKADVKFVHLGQECYEQGLVRWDKACLWHHPPQSLCIYTSIISVTVIWMMRARVRFMRTVSASLCLKTQGYQLMTLIPVTSPPPKVEAIVKSSSNFNG